MVFGFKFLLLSNRVKNCSRLLDLGSFEPLGPAQVVVGQVFSLSRVQNTGVIDDGRDGVWADVRSWSSVLNVSLTIVMHGLSWDSE